MISLIPFFSVSLLKTTVQSVESDLVKLMEACEALDYHLDYFFVLLGPSLAPSRYIKRRLLVCFPHVPVDVKTQVMQVCPYTYL